MERSPYSPGRLIFVTRGASLGAFQFRKLPLDAA